MVDENPVNRIVVDEFFEVLLVVGVESSRDVFVVILGRFLPNIKGAIKDWLREAIPEETRATISPRIVVPTPESVLGEVGNAGGVVLLLKEVKEVGVFLRESLTHRGRDKVAREGGRGVNEKEERKSEGGDDISEAVVEERKEIKDEDGADREEDREAEAERKGEFSKGRTEEFTDEGNKVEEKVTTEEEEKTDEGGGNER